MRPVAHQRIEERHRHHRLGHRHAANANTGVVAALGDHLDIRAIHIHRTARRQDRACRFDRHPHDKLLAGGNTAKNAAIVVAGEIRAIVTGAHLVTSLAPVKRGQRETATNLDTLDRIDRHHRGGKVTVQLAIDGLAKAGRYAVGNDFENRTGGTSGLADSIEIGFPFTGRHRVGAEKRVVTGLVPVKAVAVDPVRSDLHDTTADPEGLAQSGFQHPVGNGARGHTHRRLARRGPSATAIIANAVFLLIGEVGMARPELAGDLAVILRPLVLVADQHGDRGAGRHPLEHAGQNLDLIFLAALCDKTALPRLAAIKIGLQVRFGQRHTRRHPIDDAADAGAVAFTKAGEGKEGSEAVVAHVRRPIYRARRPLSFRQRDSRNRRGAFRRLRLMKGRTADTDPPRRHHQASHSVSAASCIRSI